MNYIVIDAPAEREELTPAQRILEMYNSCTAASHREYYAGNIGLSTYYTNVATGLKFALVNLGYHF